MDIAIETDNSLLRHLRSNHLSTIMNGFLLTCKMSRQIINCVDFIQLRYVMMVSSRVYQSQDFKEHT